MKSNIILSICIPTFNRAKYLEETLLSIVNQKRFQETSEVEIVISDNYSNDNTKEVSEKYISIYGEKIRYYRNSENIKDANFEKVLSYGKGEFLKLNNDTLMHYDYTLNKIIKTVNQNKENKDIVFFSNGALKNTTRCYCENLDVFVKTVSFNSTWIGSFGIWKDDFNSIEGFSRNSKLQLVQTDVLFRLISLNKKKVQVDNEKIFNSIVPKNKGGYNIYQVFVTNYIGILQQYKKKNQISWITCFNEKSKLLWYFLIPWTLILSRDKTQYSFDNKGVLSKVFIRYWFHPLFYLGILYLISKIVHMKFLSFIHLKKL